MQRGFSITGTWGGAQQSKFVDGVWQIPKRMADRLGENVKLNAPVIAIEQGKEGVTAFTDGPQYLDGALQSGIRAATEVVSALSRKIIDLFTRGVGVWANG